MSWRRLLVAVALVQAAVVILTGVTAGDREALAIGGAELVAAALLRFRSGLIGRIALAALFLNTAVWMLPAAISNIDHGESVAAVSLPVGLSLLSATGMLAAGAGTRVRGSAAAAVAAVAAFVLVVGAVQLWAGDKGPGRGDLVVRSKGLRFEPERLSARAGSVTVVMKNTDLFWHTFTIAELDLNVSVPVRGTRRGQFRAPPGTYEFICAVPGHEQAGMDGTLVVA
jgi:plastocyanin